MNILSLSKIQQPQTPIEKNKQQQSLLSTKSESDSFQRTNNVSFKANPQKVAQEILKNPKLSQKFMSLLAMGAATLIAAAQGHKSEVTETEDNDFGNLFAGFVTEEDIPSEETNELKKYKEQHLKDKEEIEILKKELAELKSNASRTTLAELQSITPENSDLVKATFPKKRGRLSKEEFALKQIVEELELPQESAEKLSEICTTLLNTKIENNEEHLKNLVENLSSFKELPEGIEKYITETHSEITTILNSKVVEQTHDENIDAVKTEEKKLIQTPKVIAKIDLDKIQPKRARIPKLNPNKDYTNTEISALDESNEIFKFKIPGTLDSNVKNNLTRLLLRYESHLAEKMTEKPKWMHARPISPRVSKLSIKKEINLRNQGDSPYKNITEDDVDLLANLINSEPRFNEHFTLHAALRLIDRLVNFNSEEPLELQTQNIIDNLLTAIQNGLSNGVEIENYIDHTYNANGARLIINSDPSINPEAFEISGSYDLILGICENQPDPKFYSTRNKTPLICTIFANGI